MLGLGLGFREAAEHAMEHWGCLTPADLLTSTSAHVQQLAVPGHGDWDERLLECPESRFRPKPWNPI